MRASTPLDEAGYYLCGPGRILRAFVGGLALAGVRSNRIHYEFFGPPTRSSPRLNSRSCHEPVVLAGFVINFASSATRGVERNRRGRMMKGLPDACSGRMR